MPTLITVPANGCVDESVDESGIRSPNITASMTDIKTLLQGIDFNDSFTSQELSKYSPNESIDAPFAGKKRRDQNTSSCGEDGGIAQTLQHRTNDDSSVGIDDTMDRATTEIEEKYDPYITTMDDDVNFDAKPQSLNPAGKPYASCDADGQREKSDENFCIENEIRERFNDSVDRASTKSKEHGDPDATRMDDDVSLAAKPQSSSPIEKSPASFHAENQDFMNRPQNRHTQNNGTYQSSKEDTFETNHRNESNSRMLFEKEGATPFDRDFNPPSLGKQRCKKIFGLHIPESASKKTFMQSYDTQVKQIIRNFKDHHGNILVDYGSLSSSDRAKHLEKVGKLLARIAGKKHKDHFKMSTNCLSLSLEGSPTFSRDKENDNRHSHQGSISNQSFENSDFISYAIDLSNSFDKASFVDANNTEINETSMALLTPNKLSSRDLSKKSENSVDVDKESGYYNAPLTDMEKTLNKEYDNNSFTRSSIEENSIESIEEPRRSNTSSSSSELLATPDVSIKLSRKRCASRSGKKGAGLTRSRLSAECSLIHHDEISLLDDDDSSPRNNMKYSPPSGDDIIFSASQSPIQHNETCLSFEIERDNTAKFDLSSTSSSHRSGMIESIQTSRGMNDRHVRWKLTNHDSFLQEAPANISMKESTDFRIKPLLVKKTKSKKQEARIRSLQFPDPLEKYNGSEGQKLTKLYKWMKKRDQAFTAATTKGGIMFSLPLGQAKDLVLKLVLESGSNEECDNEIGNERLKGRTLLVCRSKPDIEIFSRAFREESAFSVLNHAAQPLAERTRTQFASKCATFDIVLSTYDVIMSKDVVIAVNEEGHAIPQVNERSSWFSSRSSSSNDNDAVKVDKLSTLHLLDWDRVIFLDELGRKSYLAKFGTIRGKAAIALNAMSRFACFGPSSVKEKSSWETLRKSDKRAFESICRLLRMKEDGDSDSIFYNSIDFKSSKKL